VTTLAERTGISKKLVQDVLDGASMPTESMVRKFAEFFGVTFEFITGGDEVASPRRGSGAVKTGSTVRASAGKGSGAIARPSAGKGSGAVSRASASKGSGAVQRPVGGGTKRTKGGSALNVRAVATRHQALVELLVEKGVVSARDYHEMVQKIQSRG
jgi:hypothetical protein